MKRLAEAGSCAETRALPSPILDYLDQLYRDLSAQTGGQIADYIPELTKAKPDWLGISIATVDGQIYSAGEAERPFTIQSVSKPFLYAYALRELGQAAVLEQVGVEPTGEAFNSIILDEKHNRPFNPMVNAGAIAITELVKGASREEREAALMTLFHQFAGRELKIDEAVFQSEHATGHRNRAIAYMMLNTGMIARDPEEVLDLYFKQCSLSVTCADLALMAATLANDGVQPRTGESVLGSDAVRDVLTVMNTCGMYNYAGQWAFEVGMPAKSGVSGGVMAVIPGQIGIGVYSPPLDDLGNSVRGVQACKAISEEFGLHAFTNRANVRAVVRREYRGSTVGSNRLRTPQERAYLAHEGERIAVLELQGALFFGSAERLIRRIGELAHSTDFLIIDYKRVHLADAAALRLLERTAEFLAATDCRVLMTHLPPSGILSDLARHFAHVANGGGIAIHPDTDDALEWCEDALLRQRPSLNPDDATKFALAKLDIFSGLSREDLRVLEGIVQPFHFDKGHAIIREGDPARLFFVVARGTVSIYLNLEGGRKRRIACLGPGLTFGEMALLDGGPRSADVVADERVICYGLAVEAVRDLAEEHPAILITLLTNMAGEFSERLRRANEEIRTLE